MKYFALLRGINVGGNRPVEMKKLKAVFEAIGFAEVSTYLNSGNVSFASAKGKETIRSEAERALEKEFGFGIPALIKTAKEMQAIAEAVPPEWQNDTEQRTDIAFLFDEVDAAETVDGLPVNREVVDLRHIKGALIWHYDRKDRNKTRLSKLSGHPTYRLMTIRNVNTVRHLGELD